MDLVTRLINLMSPSNSYEVHENVSQILANIIVVYSQNNTNNTNTDLRLVQKIEEEVLFSVTDFIGFFLIFI